jgi:hypothetical protein
LTPRRQKAGWPRHAGYKIFALFAQGITATNHCTPVINNDRRM